MKHLWIRRFVHDFERNPKAQFRFHSCMMRVWELCAMAGPLVLIFAPGIWVKIGVLFVYELSIYANWDTDLDALAASMAAQHSEDLLARQVPDRVAEAVEAVVEQAESHVASNAEQPPNAGAA